MNDTLPPLLEEFEYAVLAHSNFGNHKSRERVKAAREAIRAHVAAIDALAAAPGVQDGQAEQARIALHEWAVARWRAEVEHRPITNVTRRPLDDAWRAVIRYAGGNPDEALGPSRDELRSRLTTNEYLALAAAAPPVSDARDAVRLDALAKVDVFDRLDFGRDGWMYADKFGAWHYGTPRECIDAAMAPPEQGVQS